MHIEKRTDNKTRMRERRAILRFVCKVRYQRKLPVRLFLCVCVFGSGYVSKPATIDAVRDKPNASNGQMLKIVWSSNLFRRVGPTIEMVNTGPSRTNRLKSGQMPKYPEPPQEMCWSFLMDWLCGCGWLAFSPRKHHSTKQLIFFFLSILQVDFQVLRVYFCLAPTMLQYNLLGRRRNTLSFEMKL